MGSELSAGADVPTFKDVSDKIEARYARAFGQAELSAETVEVRMLEVEKAAMDAEATKRLDQLRQSLGAGPAAQAPAIEKGSE